MGMALDVVAEAVCVEVDDPTPLAAKPPVRRTNGGSPRDVSDGADSVSVASTSTASAPPAPGSVSAMWDPATGSKVLGNIGYLKVPARSRRRPPSSNGSQARAVKQSQPWDSLKQRPGRFSSS
ncbi:hypothetical protein ACCO45_013025 [Purpureocillium lilacinum]|uniref:Uncharacterized protein n=1 Tax=Purpureocillium lilacinum TaxID=33203 RepID=A0ACC4DAB4_PURLI